MFVYVAENITICLMIIVFALGMVGIWELIKDPLPGDEEKQALLRQIKEMEAQSQQQRRAIFAEITEIPDPNSRSEQVWEKTNPGRSKPGRQPDPVGTFSALIKGKDECLSI